ncbi:uncharacterized protein LOC118192259, partial [Stegodyphus dumicola]|uniref:uncharacterized protein LOC118192259 n=1 Tax=Stegodyphus dumicola TaxID=202533 RepID=UPI0015AF99BE
KNSNKCDKGLEVEDTDSELSNDAMATRSQAKMSLLGSTSFCCASGQKEDYIHDAKLVPASRPPKKKPPNIVAKREPGPDPSTPSSPLVAAGKGYLGRNRRMKVNQDSLDELHVPECENGAGKLSQEDIKVRSNNHLGDSRLRPPDDRRRLTPPSPQRRLPRDPAVTRKDQIESRRQIDPSRKLRRDNTNPCVPSKTTDSYKKCSKHGNDAPGASTSSNQKIAVVVDEKPFCDVKVDVCLENYLAGHGSRGTQQDMVCQQETPILKSDNVVIQCNERFMNKSHESDDFDCPCCDRTSAMIDETGVSDTELNMFTSCDVIPSVLPSSDEVMRNTEGHCDTVRILMAKK